TMTITVRWKPVGPVLVKDSLEGAVVDTLPLTARDTRGRVRLLLPGSSIKGVLRSHAERIVRTLLDRDAPASLRTALESERLPGVVGLFGAGPQAEQAPGNGPSAQQRPDAGAEKERAAASGWRAALEIEDCHSIGHVSAQDWDKILTACTERPAPAAVDPPPRSTPVSPAAVVPSPATVLPTGAPTPLVMAALVSQKSAAAQGEKSSEGASEREVRQEFSDQREKARKKLLDLLRNLDPDQGPAADGPGEHRTGVERDDGTGLGLSVSDHVSIDRWTGGAAPGRLFSVLEPTLATAWHPIRLRVDPSRAGGPADATSADGTGGSDGAGDTGGSDGSGMDDEVAVALLLLVLRDLADGWLSVGFGRTRGHGHMEVTEVEFSGDPDRAPWNALVGRTLREILADPPPEILAALDRWAATVRAQPVRGTNPQEQETRP
ncbi:MAG: hypothetical protein QG608_3230, partial [Actinomycetota bacterium]|nr:hypothetical protein [Actinomycetota bacterium]